MRNIYATRGFTLMEVVIAIGIFSIVSLVVSSIFMNVNNLQRTTANYQRLQNDGRYMIEKMAREIRGRELILIEDTNPTSMVSFYEDKTGQNEPGQTVQIKYDSIAKDLNYSVDGLTQKLNADDVIVESVKFYVLPIQSFGTTINVQPRVIILLKIKNKSSDVRNIRSLVLQTTISSKIYKR